MGFFGDMFSAWQVLRESRARSFVFRTDMDEDRGLGSLGRAQLRAELEALMRDDPMFSGAVRRIATNVVGNGIQWRPKTGDKEWDEAAKEYFDFVSNASAFDEAGELSLSEAAWMVVMDRYVRGESFFIKRPDGQVAARQADLCVTPAELEGDENWSDGVLRDSKGHLVRYAFAPRTADGIDRKAAKNFQFDRRSIIHPRWRMTFEMIRGYPQLAPAIMLVKDLKRIHSGLIRRILLEARKGFFLLSDRLKGPSLAERGTVGSAGSDVTEKTQKINVGDDDLFMHYLERGGSIKSAAIDNPGRNNQTYLESKYRTFSQFAGFTYEFLFQDFRNGSFSSDRTKILATTKELRAVYSWLVSWFLQPWLEYRLAEAVRVGDLPPPPCRKIRFLGIEINISCWNRGVWIMGKNDLFDPKKQAEAYALEWCLGSASLDDIGSDQGMTGDEMLERKHSEIDKAAALAADHNKNWPEDRNSWRDYINASRPGVVTAAPAAGGDDSGGGSKSENED